MVPPPQTYQPLRVPPKRTSTPLPEPRKLPNHSDLSYESFVNGLKLPLKSKVRGIYPVPNGFISGNLVFSQQTTEEHTAGKNVFSNGVGKLLRIVSAGIIPGRTKPRFPVFWFLSNRHNIVEII